MMTQGVLGFQYEVEPAGAGVTALGGLPLYLELIDACGLAGAIKKYVSVAGKQGWLDLQMVLSLIFLNLAGGDCMEDLDRLEQDRGFTEIMRRVERHLLSRTERKEVKARWRRERTRVLPSPSSVSDWLARFHDEEMGKERVPGTAIIPKITEKLQSLWQVNQELVQFLQTHQRSDFATLDMDATLIETHKREALHSYKGFKAYQPLNCWWAEQGMMLYSEFRDGNVPAGFEHLRVLKESLLTAASAGVKKVYFRADSAAYLQDLLLYCGEGKDEQFGVIEFAVSADVTQEFRTAVRAVSESEWNPLYRSVDGFQYKTDQEWAEVCFVPNWAGHSKNRADYRFLAIREPLRQLELGDAAQLPFPTESFGPKGRFKLFGVVTNRKLPGDEVIWWLRQRCGKSEEVHSVLKDDLAGGQLPTDLFGANAAWWAIAILSHNLNALMKRLVLGPNWVAKRMKAVRFALINLPGRVVSHARRLVIRINEAAMAMIVEARKTIRSLASAPAG
jgi:Transposase DDE domain group 1